MGLLRYLRGTDILDSTSTPDEVRALPRAENELPAFGATLSTGDLTGAIGVPPIQMTPAKALAIGDVWAAVRCLADAASSLPLHVYRRADDGARQRVSTGRLVDLLDRPGPATSQADLISSLMAHLLIYGNGYLAKYRDAGEVVQLGLLEPERVRVAVEGGRVRYEYSAPNARLMTLTDADVVHVKGLSIDGATGLSAVRQAARVIGLSDELVLHALTFFERGRERPAGVLQVSPGMSNEAMSRLQEALKAAGRHHGVMILEADTEFHALSGSLDDAQFIEQRRLVATEVARVFRIPPHMIGAPTGDSLTYSTVEQQSLDFVRYSLTPWLRRIELALSNDRDLTFDRQYVKAETDALLRADAKTRAEVYHLALDPVQGWMTRDEVRRLEDLEPEQDPPPIAAALNAMNVTPEVNTNGSS
jgi:HK97 family phage portal protein